MRQALSARYGGLLVEASECDYTSFKHLHLLCPNCKKTVFLVGAKAIEPHVRKLKDDRTTQVKGSTVDSYFAHHPDVSVAAVEVCELRVRSMSETEKTFIKSEFRKQLLKTLHSHFWRVLSTSIFMRNHEFRIKTIRNVWLEASVNNQYKAQALYDLLISSIVSDMQNYVAPKINESLYSIFDLYSDQVKRTIYVDEAKRTNFIIDKSAIDFLSLWDKELDSKLQCNIAAEMYSFCCQPRQRPILTEVVESALYEYCFAQAAIFSKEHTKNSAFDQAIELFLDNSQITTDCFVKAVRILIGMTNEHYQNVFKNVIRAVLGIFVYTDWASEYERLQNAELEKQTVVA